MYIISIGSCVKIISAKTIYPCLDSYDILITNATIRLDLVRIYTTDDIRASFRHFRYQGEIRVPLNNLIKVDCTYFSTEYRYYCFSVVKFGLNGSIVYWDNRPLCRPTLADDTVNNGIQDSLADNSMVDNPIGNLTTLAPYGPSFQIVNYGDNYYHQSYLSTSLDEDKADGNINTDMPVRVYCVCNQVISLNISNTVFVVQSDDNETNGCPLSSSMAEDYLPDENSIRNDSTQCATCVLRLDMVRSDPVVALKLVRIIQCDQRIVSLIIRDGQSSIDPMLDVTEEWSEYALNSRYLLFQTTGTSIRYIVKLRLIQDNSDQYRMDKSLVSDGIFDGLVSVSSMHIILFGFLVSLFCSIVILWCVSYVTKSRASKVQILLTDDGPATSTSYLNNGSVDQFSFNDADSMEMDYYDYTNVKQ